MKEWKTVGVADIAARTPNALATGPFGSSIGSRFFRTSGVPVIRGGNLSADSAIRINDENLVYLSPEKAAEFSRSTVRSDDLIFTSWGTINQVGLIDKSAAFDEYIISNKQMKLTPDPQTALSEFLYYLFSGPAMQREILEGSIGTGVPGFNLTRLRSIQIQLPPMEEQRKIAAALSDAECLERTLRASIAKKHAIKQGLMQQLLTGRTRLSGFAGRWREEKLADVSTLKGRIGWQGLTQDEFTTNPSEPFLITGMNFKDGLIRWSEVYHVSEDRYAVAPEIQLRLGDVLMTKDGTIGKLLYVDHIPHPGRATLNSHLLLFRPKNDAYNPRFLYYQLGSPRFAAHVEENKSGTTFFGISQSAVGKYMVLLPPLDEQRAIGQVLADADDEIALLKRRLTKAQDIKAGMMQQLLTGRTRLLTKEAAA